MKRKNKKYTQLERRIIRLAKELRENAEFLIVEAEGLIQEPVPTSNGDQLETKREVYKKVQSWASTLRKVV